MYLTLSFPDGRRIDAVLLSVTRDEMRVVIPGQPDAVTFRLVNQQWTSEEGEPIELDSLFSIDSAVSDRISEKAGFRAAAAGGSTFPM